MTSVWSSPVVCLFFFFNDTATTEIYTLSLHDALPILTRATTPAIRHSSPWRTRRGRGRGAAPRRARSEEHTSELQVHSDVVWRLLLEKKKHARCRFEVRHHRCAYVRTGSGRL